MLEHLTFLLAVAGYAGLAATAVGVVGGRPAGRFWHVSAAIIVLHVALVWAFGYEWRLAVATRNGYAGFVVFHLALALKVADAARIEHDLGQGQERNRFCGEARVRGQQGEETGTGEHYRGDRRTPASSHWSLHREVVHRGSWRSGRR